MVMLATMAAGVVTFYFGSSSSGKVKDETIQLLAKTSPTSPTSPTVATVENMAANTAANTASTTENTIKTAENTAAVLATSKAEGDGE
jgi:hypothetical protein